MMELWAGMSFFHAIRVLGRSHRDTHLEIRLFAFVLLDVSPLIGPLLLRLEFPVVACSILTSFFPTAHASVPNTFSCPAFSIHIERPSGRVLAIFTSEPITLTSDLTILKMSVLCE